LIFLGIEETGRRLGSWQSIVFNMCLGRILYQRDEKEKRSRTGSKDFIERYVCGMRELSRNGLYQRDVVNFRQAYGFMNGVLNTDNTSIYGLSLDFGPFAVPFPSNSLIIVYGYI
jgi:hypothetical protein